MNKKLNGLLMLPALLLLWGCATPQARIDRHPDLFQSFPPEVQRNVKEGRIEIGYSKAMVYMALGNPDRIYKRQTQNGATTIWAYQDVDRYYSSLGSPHFMYHYGYYPRRYYLGAPFHWTPARRDVVHDVLRVEFQDEHVIAIEQEES